MVNGDASVFDVDLLGWQWVDGAREVVAVSRIVMFRDIEPDDAERCSGHCPWREGQLCTLFFAQLVPVTGSLFETKCLRTGECVASERRAAAWQQFKRRATKENES